MDIGYGSVSVYDSIRHKLIRDGPNDAYFVANNRKYRIKLNANHIYHILNNKKIWVTLTQLPPSRIDLINFNPNENEIKYDLL